MGDLKAARAAIAAGRYDAALKALAGAPPSPRRDVALGAAHVGRWEPARAFPYLHAALAAAPDDPEALYWLGGAHLAANEAFAAVAAYERAFAAAPEWPGLRDALVAAYRRDARYADAVRLAEAAEAAGVASVQTFYEKAVSLERLGEAEAALAAYDAALARDPDRAAAWFGSHGPALQLRGVDTALERLRRATACAGANGKYWSYVWVYEALRGRGAAAQAVYDARLADHPKRRHLADGVAALRPHLAPDFRLFGVSAHLLRHALGLATAPGLVLEFGVRRGTSLRHVAAAAGQTVHGFDSFEGLPESWIATPRGALTAGATPPEAPVNAVLHPGWFDDTLPTFLAKHGGPVRFVNIDSDLYSSAKTVLTALAPRIQPGTILVFDEFVGNRTWRDDEYKAFQEFVRDFGVVYDYAALAPATKQVAARIAEIDGRR